MHIWVAEMDRMGHVHLWPKRKDLQKKLAKHMEEMTNHYDHVALIQGDESIATFMVDNLSKENQKWIEKGYEVYFKADSWSMALYYGWDAQTLFE